MGGEVLFLPSKSVDISRLINMQNSQIREALNAPGHPAICTAVYFNSKGELIIEVDSDDYFVDGAFDFINESFVYKNKSFIYRLPLM